MVDKKSKRYQEERERVIADLLGHFYCEADYPLTEDFELAHEAAFRLNVFEDLQRDELIKIFHSSQYGFHLLLYIESSYWERDRDTIEKMWPVLQEWRRTKRDDLFSVEALAQARPQIPELEMNRALILLNQLGLIAGQPRSGSNFRYQTIQVYKAILKYEGVQDKIDQGIREGYYDLTYKKPYDPLVGFQDAGLASLVTYSAPAKERTHTIYWYAAAAGIIGLGVSLYQVWGAPSMRQGTVINNAVTGNQSIVLNNALAATAPAAAKKTTGLSDPIAARLMAAVRKTNCSGHITYLESSKASEELSWRISGIMGGAGCGLGTGGQFTGEPYGVTWEITRGDENSALSRALEKAFKDAGIENHKKVRQDVSPGEVRISVGMLR